MTQKVMASPVKKNGMRGFFREMRVNKALYIMLTPAVAFIVIFNYVPLYGLQVAFRNFNFIDGISGSPFVGLKNFNFYFKSMFFKQTTFNTLYLNTLFIAANVFMQVTTAVLLNEVTRRQQKAFQTAMFFPYFISWVVISQFVTALLSEKFGMVNNIIRSFGGEGVSWFTEPKYWPAFLTISSVWKNLGYGSVIYLAKIVGIDAELYEAARIDGASRFQEVTRVTLPLLVPTIVLLLLIAIGGVFRGDFQMIYSLITDQKKMLIGVTEVIDTYVYRAMRVNSQYGMAAAIGLYQSVMGFILVMFSNFLVTRYDPDIALF